MKGIDPDHKPQRNWRGEAGLKLPFYRRGWFSALLALILLGVVAARADRVSVFRIVHARGGQIAIGIIFERLKAEVCQRAEHNHSDNDSDGQRGKFILHERLQN